MTRKCTIVYDNSQLETLRHSKMILLSCPSPNDEKKKSVFWKKLIFCWSHGILNIIPLNKLHNGAFNLNRLANLQIRQMLAHNALFISATKNTYIVEWWWREWERSSRYWWVPNKDKSRTNLRWNSSKAKTFLKKKEKNKRRRKITTAIS